MNINYFEKLQQKVDKYKTFYEKHPKKAMLHLLMWNFKSLFKKYSVNENITKNYVLNGVSPKPPCRLNNTPFKT